MKVQEFESMLAEKFPAADSWLILPSEPLDCSVDSKLAAESVDLVEAVFGDLPGMN